MKFKLVLETDLTADAFSYDECEELARILRATADKIENKVDCATLYDSNGNSCGKYSFSG